MFTVTIPLPSLDDASAKELKKILSGMQKASEKGPIRGGVISEGDAAAYALVWEWGNARQVKKGPKTVQGTNPDGDTVWLSIQAPYGYVRIHEEQYVKMLEEELGDADFGGMGGDEILQALRKVSLLASNRCAQLIRETVPVDSGDLRDSIVAADPDDPDLKDNDQEIELGSKRFKWKG